LPAALADGAPHCETSLLWPLDAAPSVLRFVAFVRGLGTRPAAGRAKPADALGYRSR
jgi:hypothetical protein